MGVRQCYICHAVNESIELHHIIMQAAGGEEGPTVPLCSTCHTLSHKQALNFEAKTAKTVMMFSPDQWERAKNIVGYIQLAIRKNKENPNFNDPSNVQIKLTKNDVFLLHLMKSDAGYTNLTKYLTDMIRANIRARFPTTARNRRGRS